MAGGRARGGDRERGAGDAEFHRDVAGAGVGHGFRNGQRVHAIVAELVDLGEPDVFGRLAADTGAGDDGGVLAQLRRPLDSGIGDRLARGDDGELREAVHEIGAAIVEVRPVAVVGHLGAVLKTNLRHVGGLNRTDTAAAETERLGEFRGVAAERADGAGSRYGDAPHRLLGRRAGVLRRYQLFDAGAHIADAAHGTRFFIGDGDVEFVFEREENFHGIHGVDIQRLEVAIDRYGLERNSLG